MKFLLATHHLRNWGGSELVTIELAEDLTRSGHSVEVVASQYDQNFIEDAFDFSIKFLSSFDEVCSLENYDLIYSHHGMLSRLLWRSPAQALTGASRPKFIYNHLSPTELFERPISLSEMFIADFVFVNSSETKIAVDNIACNFFRLRSCLIRHLFLLRK